MMKADNPFVFDIKHFDIKDVDLVFGIKEYGYQRLRLSKSTAIKEYVRVFDNF